MRQSTDEQLEPWRREDAERQRLREIQDQLWLDSLSPDARAAILDSRRHIAARERVAQEILRREQAAEAITRNGAPPGRRSEG